MKKINFKAIMILALAFILVFSLVACNKPEPEPQEEPKLTSAEYFTNLWNLTSGIGSENIAESDDIALHADLALDLSLVESSTDFVNQSVNVGLGLDIVLDRTSADSHNSALKVNAYDPDNGENWLTAYFFFNDPSNIYLDVAGSNIALPFDYKNDTYAGSLHKLIFEKVVMGEGDKALKINDIINLLTKDMGASWSLDNLIDSVIKMLGVDLKGVIDGFLGEGTISDVLGTDLFDEKGNLKLKELLTTPAISGMLFFDPVKTTSGNMTTYSTRLQTGFVFGMLVNAIPMDGIDQILNESTVLQLDYTQNGNEFDHFTLSLGLQQITAMVNDEYLYPRAALTINGFEVRKATAQTNTFGIDRTNYSSDVVFEEEVELNLDGITLNPSVFSTESNPIELAPIRLSNVELAVGIKGKLDLKNKENNGTFANAWVRLGNKHFIDMSFKDGVLGLKIDQNVKIGDLGVMDAIAKAAGKPLFDMIHNMFIKNNWDDAGFNDFADLFFAKNEDKSIDYTALNPEFKGAVWKNLDIVGGFQGLVDQVINKIMQPQPTPPPATTSAAAAEQQPSILDQVIKTVQASMSLIDTQGNKLTVKSDDIFAKVVEIGKIYNKDFKVQTVIDAIIAKDASKMLEKFANFIQIEGLEKGSKTDAEFAVDFLKAVFTDLSGELTLDLSENGIDLSAKIEATGNVKVSVTSSFTTEEFAAADFIDIGAEYESAQSKVGWIAFVL